ncbi:PEBP-like protein [Phlegmacium glaucopus]|nr:PEBP-like protein [Phlegmacium glaucopus]
MFSAILSIALVLQSASAQTTSPLINVTNAFSSSHLVPNVIPTFNPIALLNVSFADTATKQSINVVPGVLLSTEQTAIEPKFSLGTSSAALPTTPFVLVIVDPDAPTPQAPTLADFLHFLGGGFTVDSTTRQLTNNTAALMEFFPPSPPAGSDPHRYPVLLFNQPSNFNTVAPTLVNASTPRTSFNLSSFVQAVKLGDPLAGNYFLVGPANTSTSATQTNPSQTSVPSASATSNGSSNKFYKMISPAVEAAFCMTTILAFLVNYV